MKVVRHTPISDDLAITIYRSDDNRFIVEDHLGEFSKPEQWTDANKTYNTALSIGQRAYAELSEHMLATVPLDDYSNIPPIHKPKPKRKRLKIKDNRLKPHQRRKAWAKVTASSVSSKISSNPDAGKVVTNAKIVDPIRYSYQKGRKLGESGRDMPA